MIDYALSPLTWLLVGVLVHALAGRRRWLAQAGAALMLAATVLMTPLAANLLVHAVESRAPSPQACAAATPDYIVVLAGGVEREPANAADVGALAAVGVRRLEAAIERFRHAPRARLLIVGRGNYAVPESELLAHLARDLGVPAEAIRTERASTTTWQNARYAAALDAPPPQRFWLVTSALHMARALIAFRAAGFDPCPLVSDSVYAAPGGIGYFLPRTSALRKSETALHEIVGGAAYRLRASPHAHRGEHPAELP
jgi:uncharacterized SAM-binding protein YcdF (DUF218 family)